MTNAKSSAQHFETQDLIVNLAKFADEKNWNQLRGLFAPKVVLDYFDFPEILKAEQILYRWQSLLPAFDRTHHEISNIKVEQKDGRTLGTADVVGAHFIKNMPNGDRWVIQGRYEFEASNVNGQNVISRLRLITLKSKGEQVLAEAQRRAGIQGAERRYTVEHVEFESHGVRLKGWLLKPKEVATNDVVILGGTWTSVKEQMAYPYAQLIAEKGYPVLIFDFAGFGESGGSPRHYENPESKIRNFMDAIDFITSRPEFNSKDITLAGICASAQYVAAVAGLDPRVKKLVLIAPWIHDKPLVEAVYGSLPGYGGGGVQGRMSAGDRAREKYEKTGETEFIPAASSTDERAAMYFKDPNVIDFYLNEGRGNIPVWGNKMALMSWGPWLNFDGVATGAGVKVPSLIVHSEDAAIPDGVKQFARLLKVKPEVHWISGTQFDFYDNPSQMNASVNYFNDFMRSESRKTSEATHEQAPID